MGRATASQGEGAKCAKLEPIRLSFPVIPCSPKGKSNEFKGLPLIFSRARARAPTGLAKAGPSPGPAWALGLLVGIDLVWGGMSLIAMALSAPNPTG